MRTILNKKILSILYASSLINILADILLYYGNKLSNQGISSSSLQNSNLTLVQIGATLGLFTIPFWLLPVTHFSLIAVNKTHKTLITYSYVAFVIGALAYHVAYGYLGNAAHFAENERLHIENEKLLLINGLYNLISALVFSITIVMAKIKGALNFHWVNFLFLPFTSILLFQILFNQLVKIPAPIGGYFVAINGTLVILIFFISLNNYKISDKNETRNK